MKNTILILLIPFAILIIVFSWSGCKNQSHEEIPSEYTGSQSCRSCHEEFHQLWSDSHHGKAMQPVTASFLETEVSPMEQDILIEGKKYRIVIEDTTLICLEKNGNQLNKYTATWALGGKNVYYFLTPITKGRLQTLPLAYDLNDSTWYDNPKSAIRHFADGMPDEAVSWKDHLYTFNTTCYSCHVSQLTTNFDLSTLTYNTLWKEAGINCETCHGPSGEHIRVCEKAGEGNVPEDLKLIVTSTFTHDQHNSSCASCHAKMRPLSSSYPPGETFFDHFDLITLENPDFYPDGRDLGENYTHTTWMQSECVQSGQLDCIHCHTASGRYRFQGTVSEGNQACLPCHKDNVSNPEPHTFHPADSAGSRCINCHMPKTKFGRMIRSDHSMRPPMPSATIEFESPNACNICHDDKSAGWADKFVREWRDRDYQAPVLYNARLIKTAREENWSNLDMVLEALDSNRMDEVFTTSLIRLLAACESEEKWPTIEKKLDHKSPLVRSAAANAMIFNPRSDVIKKLLNSAKDKYRVVRLAAASSLSTVPINEFTAEEKQIVNNVLVEYKNSLVTRHDDWSSHYNLGNFYHHQGQLNNAILSYETANKLYDQALEPLINSSIVYSQLNDPANAERSLQQALEIDPENEAANLNMGLLSAEMGKTDNAIRHLRKVLKINPESAVSAYNLSVLIAEENPDKAIEYSRQAWKSNPDNPKYGYTYAFFLNQNGQTKQATGELKTILKKDPGYIDAIFLLGNIYEESDYKHKAVSLYKESMKSGSVPEQIKIQLNNKINSLEQSSDPIK